MRSQAPACRARIPAMAFSSGRSRLIWLLAWLALAVAGASWLAHARLLALEEAFVTDARIVHRVLSQRAVQHDAVMATLPLLQPPPEQPGGEALPLLRLPSAYPQMLEVLRRLPGDVWPAAWPAALRTQMQAAAARSGESRHAELAQQRAREHIENAEQTLLLEMEQLRQST